MRAEAVLLIICSSLGCCQQIQQCPGAQHVERASISSLTLTPWPLAANAWERAVVSITFDNATAVDSSLLYVVIEPIVNLVGAMFIEHRTYRLCGEVLSDCSQVVPGATVEGEVWYHVHPLASAVTGGVIIQARLVDAPLTPGVTGPSAVVWSATLGCVRIHSTTVASRAPNPPPPNPFGPCVQPSPCGRPTAPGHRRPYCTAMTQTYYPNSADCDGDGLLDHLCYDTRYTAYSFSQLAKFDASSCRLSTS